MYAPRVQTVSCFRADLGAPSAAERPISGRPTATYYPLPDLEPKISKSRAPALDPPFLAARCRQKFLPHQNSHHTRCQFRQTQEIRPAAKPLLSRSSRCVWSSSAAVSFRGWARVSFSLLSFCLVNCRLRCTLPRTQSKPELPLHEIYFYLPRDATRLPGAWRKMTKPDQSHDLNRTN